MRLWGGSSIRDRLAFCMQHGLSKLSTAEGFNRAKYLYRRQPWSREGCLRIEAADTILRLLVDAQETEFTIPELVDATGAARSTVWRAVDLLDAIGTVRIRETPQRNYVSIDPSRIHKDDPILAIDQLEFHAPIRAFVTRVKEALTSSSA